VSARSKARKHSLDILYEADIRKSDPLAIIETRLNVSEEAESPPVRDYTKDLVSGVTEHKRKIDELIATYIQGWDLDRLAAVDRNILRIAIFEILWAKEIPDAVAIDEALTLAKDLSTEESAGYIHGVLAKIASIKSDLSL
jgi:N utilization substance protein B